MKRGGGGGEKVRRGDRTFRRAECIGKEDKNE